MSLVFDSLSPSEFIFHFLLSFSMYCKLNVRLIFLQILNTKCGKTKISSR